MHYRIFAANKWESMENAGFPSWYERRPISAPLHPPFGCWSESRSQFPATACTSMVAEGLDNTQLPF
jgi:hypothetical protein